MLRLILAVLFRAGSIEVTHGGEKFAAYQDPRSRTPLVNNTAFKSALFTPVKPIDLHDAEAGGRELRGPDRRDGGRGQGGHRRGPEGVRRRGDEAGAAGRGPGQGPQRPGAGDGRGLPGLARRHRVGLAGRLRDHPGGRRRVAEAGPRPGSQDRRVPGREGPGDPPQRPAGGRARSGASSKPRGRPTPAQGRGASGILLSGEALFESLSSIQEASQEILAAYRTLYEAPPRRPDRAVPGGDREDQGAGGLDRRARDDAGAGAGPAPVPVLRRPEAAGRLPGLRVVPGRARARWSRTWRRSAGCSPRSSPRSRSSSRRPRSPLQAGAGRRVLRRAAGDEDQVRQAVARLQDHLLKLLGEGVKIVVE